MKGNKRPPGNDLAWVNGFQGGLLIMGLMWAAGTGLQHPGLILGGSILLLVSLIGTMVVVKRRSRKL